MKTINFKISLVVVLMMLISSCNLNKFPFDSIEQSQSFKTIKDATTLNNGLYASLRGDIYGIFTYSTDVQADEMNATLDYGNRNGFPYTWSGFLSDDYTISGVWSGFYATLANVNNVINNIGKIPQASVSDSAQINGFLGQAYLMRAYIFHQLVLRYAKAYNPTTAGSDPGVPLVLTFDITLLPSRSTVAQTYTQITGDIAKAKTLLSKVTGVQNSTKLTYDCVLALEARVALYMQNWQLALTDANLLISSGKYPLINNKNSFQSMWTNDIGSEIIFRFFASEPTELPNANDIYLRFNPANNQYDPDFVPELWVVNLYDNADIRKSVYLAPLTLNIQGATYPGIYCINKFPGNPALFTAATSNYEQAPKVFMIGEQYLISAEAAAQSPTTQAAALATLNVLRVARGIPALSGLTGTNLTNAIRDERTRELLGEGFRLDDLKRWGLGFTRSAPQNLNLIVTGTDYNLKTVLPTDPKFVWGIPANDIKVNPNLAQNPGW